MRITLCLLLAACTSSSSTGTVSPKPLAGPPANTSIATAMALPPGATLDFELPCDGTPIYFGPFAFATEGEKLGVVSQYRSSGAQICGAGALVDEHGAQVQASGLGCTQSPDVATQELAYAYTPGAGGPSQTPLFLEYRVGDPKPAGCIASRGTLHRP